MYAKFKIMKRVMTKSKNQIKIFLLLRKEILLGNLKKLVPYPGLFDISISLAQDKSKMFKFS